MSPVKLLLREAVKSFIDGDQLPVTGMSVEKGPRNVSGFQDGVPKLVFLEIVPHL